jgi:hypothetical protein
MAGSLMVPEPRWGRHQMKARMPSESAYTAPGLAALRYQLRTPALNPPNQRRTRRVELLCESLD